MAHKIHRYRGELIKPCPYAKGEHSGRWYIHAEHHTGMPYACTELPHYATLSDAELAIDAERQTARRD